MHKRSPLDVETYQEMHRTTSQRMDYVQGGRRKSTVVNIYTALFHPNQSADDCCIHRVTFNDCVTVYPIIEKVRGCVWQ